jgi:hypothetical protein
MRKIVRCALPRFKRVFFLAPLHTTNRNRYTTCEATEQVVTKIEKRAL